MVNCRARIGLGAPRLAACRGVCCSSSVGFGRLTRIAALQNWRGTDPHASSHPRPPQTKQKLQGGQSVAQHLPTAPAKKSHLPCQHPRINNRQREAGQAHWTLDPVATSIPFASSTLPSPPIPASFSNVAPAVTRLGRRVCCSAGLHSVTTFPCHFFPSVLLLFSICLYFTIPHERRACPCDQATRPPRWTTSTSTSTRRSSST